MSFTMVTLTGTVNLQPGTPAAGATVAVELSTPITDGTTSIQPTTLNGNTVTCNSAGQFTLGPIPALDDATTSPQGAYYTVQIGTTESYQTFRIALSRSSAPSVDVFSLTPLGVISTPPSPFVLSLQGLNGPVLFSSPDESVTISASGNTITFEAGSAGNVDGGNAISVYAPGTGVNGGNASGD